MIKTLAIVLHKQNLGETDRIITLLSPRLGRVRAVARGVRRPLSRLAGHLDTLMISQLILTDEVELPKITSANLVEALGELRSDLRSVNRAFAVSRLINRVTVENIEQAAIFALTVDSLRRIAKNHPWPAVWLKFLSELTRHLGLGQTNFSCQSCGRLPTSPTKTSPTSEDGWLIVDHHIFCAKCRNDDPTAINLSASAVKLMAVLHRRPPAFIARVKFDQVIGLAVEEVYLTEIAAWLNKPWQTYRALGGLTSGEQKK